MTKVTVPSETAQIVLSSHFENAIQALKTGHNNRIAVSVWPNDRQRIFCLHEQFGKIPASR